MKLLRDVATRPRGGTWAVTPFWGDEYEDEERDNTHDYYGAPYGRTECCYWNYSLHSLNLGLIRHHNYCDNFNPNGLNEF